MINAMRALEVTPDFIVHTGDIVAAPDPRSYRRAAELFREIDVPLYYVTGNHDEAHLIHEYLEIGPRSDWQSGSDRLAYEFTVRDEDFVVLDGRGPDEIDPHGVVSEPQLERVRELCRNPGPRLTIFVHFPLLTMHSPWFDSNMLLLNGAELHAALLPARDRLRGVFTGHIHQSMQMHRDGICYTSVPSTFANFLALPDAEQAVLSPDSQPGFNVVHCLPDHTLVQQHSVPRE